VNPKDTLSLKEASTYLGMDSARSRRSPPSGTSVVATPGAWIFSKSIDKWRGQQTPRP
jgi:hypothetical protein